MTASIDITPGQKKTLLALLRRFIPGVEVWAYGSRVKWTARPNSDLDLVAFTTPTQQGKVSELKEALAESDLPFLVDLHVWDEVPERFHEIIRNEFIVLQTKTKQLDRSIGNEAITGNVGDIAAPIRNALVGGPFGSDLVSRDYVPSGVPVIRGTNMGHGRWVDGEFVYVTPEKADSLASNCAKPGDLVFTQRGTLGQVALVPKKGADRYLISQSQMKVTVDAEKADALFLYYVFTSAEQQAYIRQNAIQTGVPHTNLGILRNTPLTLPPLAEQKAIALVLGALDDKIELNRRMNATLEAMARTLFQSWFVDFDPVRAKLDGYKPTGLDASTAALFPATFQDSPLGHIPQGWAIKPVGKVVDCVGGGTPSTAEPKYWDDGTHHWTTPKDFSSLRAPILLDTDRKITDAGIAKISSGLLPAGTLLLSSRAPVGYLAIAAIPVAINQGFIAMKCNERASNFFMLNWCQANMTEIESRATGTTFAEISKQNFRPIPVVLPPKELMAAFTAKVTPLYAKITANLQQSRTLATLRDSLLPKLLSGELRVAGVQRDAQMSDTVRTTIRTDS